MAIIAHINIIIKMFYYTGHNMNQFCAFSSTMISIQLYFFCNKTPEIYDRDQQYEK